jgi:hypothetical protein
MRLLVFLLESGDREAGHPGIADRRQMRLPRNGSPRNTTRSGSSVTPSGTYRIHHGGVPRALQQYFIRLFNARKIPFLLCTSTIIEGGNTVAKNVIVYDRRKSRDVLEHFTYKNIEGRAGRMNQYFVGKVYVLESPPPNQSFTVEFPVGAQRAGTPLSLLLSLPDEDLEPVSQTRIEELFKNSSVSAATLRANRHVGWEIPQRQLSWPVSDNYDGR